jgi:hypothetical protein
MMTIQVDGLKPSGPSLNTEEFGLTSQIQRAAVSVPSASWSGALVTARQSILQVSRPKAENLLDRFGLQPNYL